MATAVETMTQFMDVLKRYSNDTTTSGITILDNAVREVSRFNSLQEAIDSFVNDVTDTSNGANVYERLNNTCGIIVGKDEDFTADTGAVSGYNAGGTEVKDAQSIVPEIGTMSDLSMPEAGSTTTHTYTGKDGKTFTFYIKWPQSFTQVEDRKWQTSKTYNPSAWTTEELTNQTFVSDLKNNEDTKTYTAAQFKSAIETITKGMYNWWAEESAKMIYDDYGLDFNGKTINVTFFANQEDTQADTAPLNKNNNDTTPADTIRMSFGLPIYGIIDSEDVNGDTRIEDGADQNYLDRTVAHEMVHAVMQASGTLKDYEATMPEFFTEGVAELIMGLDDYDANNTASIIELANDRTKLADAMVLAGGTGTNIRYTSGYMFLRYLCWQNVDTQDLLAVIDSKGEDYIVDLLLQVLGGHSVTQSSMLKATDYLAPTSDFNVSAVEVQNSEAVYQFPDMDSIDPTLLYGSGV